MLIESRRADLLDKQLQDQVKQMQHLNAKIALANKMLAYARTQQSVAMNNKKKGTSKDDSEIVGYETVTDKDGKTHQEPLTFRQWAQQNGVSLHDRNDDNLHNKDEWSAIIESVKGKINALNSTSQMDMIRLQSLMNKRNQAYELMTNALQKLSGSLDKIIGNIR